MKRRLFLAFGGLVLIGAVVLAVIAPWAPPPLLVYENVSGWPMRVYYRNLGEGPGRLAAVGGVPALSYERPLSAQEIDVHLAAIKASLKPAPTLVKAGDFVWFEVDDPAALALEQPKAARTSWLYVFVVVEMPRAALINQKWISELCLVAKKGEAFHKCDTHNNVYAASS